MKMGKRNTFKNPLQKGFVLVEVILAAALLVLVAVGIFQLLLYCPILSKSAGNATIALQEAQKTMENIRNTDYTLIPTNYGAGGTPGNTFNLINVTGKGIIYIDSLNSGDLLKITIAVSWRDQNKRVIGEDKDLDGVLDGGEDLNGDGRLSSAYGVTLVSNIARR